MSIGMFGKGWTPTDAGFVINLDPGDQFLLSVWVDLNNNKVEDAGEEFFVCDYPSYHTETGRFRYEAKDYLKLIPQTAGVTVPSPASVWTVAEPLTRKKDKISFPLGGEAYTMWGNSNKTLVTSDGTFKFLGSLSADASNSNLCDVVFVVPSDNSRTVCMDPENTLGRAAKKGDKFNSQMGTGFAGMVYREVYWFDLPRSNYPENAYTNAALVTFNTTDTQKSWSSGQIKCNPGMAAYAYADSKHNPTTRTVFRLYLLNDQAFSSCSSYYFGWDVQDTRRYRTNTNNPQKLSDSTELKKIYRLDHFECMERVGSTKYYQTRGRKLPSDDSTYFYVGYNDRFLANEAIRTASGCPTNFLSHFQPISELRIRPLNDAATTYNPPKSAYGSFAIDTTSSATNLGVSFEPSGYFLKVSTGFNVQMKRLDDTTWISEEMWTISDKWAALSIKATLFTGPEYSSDDPGADIAGWSIPIVGNTVPLADGSGTVGDGSTGWARIHTNRTTPNGGMDFVLADGTRELVYDYQGLVGITIPKQYPMSGETTVKVQDARLKAGFTFLGWATERGGDVVYWTTDSIGKPGKSHFVGDDITVRTEPDTLYAVGYFNDTYRVAFSFIHGGKRYFLTHPGTAPRFARARTYTDWTDVYQGMSDENNSEPNYLTTYKMIVNPVCVLCEDSDVVLDPRHETVHGAVDSLTFYERWVPENDEYIGLYYDKNPFTGEYINTVLANNTWAGIFKSTEGWPSYRRTEVSNTKLYSTHYFAGMMDRSNIEKKWRGRPVDPENPSGDSVALAPYIKYDASLNQFDGDIEANATTFQITGIAVADEHYIVLPDTAEGTPVWRNQILFDYHKDEKQLEQVWSKLIGKQLLAVIRVGEDTVYLHPNRNKIFTTANALRLSNDFRLSHDFEFIRDTRPDAAISTGDSVMMEETSDAFCCNITSGMSSPMNVMDGANYIDIVDTLRVWLHPGAQSKIKRYYGRWKTGAAGVHVRPDGSRYRDVLIKTKTYHYGDTKHELILTPKEEIYGFSALKDQKRRLEFKLTKVTYRELLDVDGNIISKDTITTKDTTSVLDLSASMCSLKGATFTKVDASIHADSVVLKTAGENSEGGALVDTLTVTIPANTYGTHPALTTKVPLIQASLQGDELIWSVVDPSTKKRYFIMAGQDGEGVGSLIFREYNLSNNTLYQQGTKTALIKGIADEANSNTRYITPWIYAEAGGLSNQLTLSIKLSESNTKNFAISGSTGTIGASPTTVTYQLVHTYANDNANYEEVVKLKTGATTWLKFNGSDIVTTENSEEASLFYWGYLLQEYSLLNNGAYPSVDELGFGYNNGASKSVQTRYKAYREYSMLLNNSLTYLCREEEKDMADLINGSGDWKAYYSITKIDDSRFAAGASGLTSVSTNTGNLVTTITPSSATSPKNIRYPAVTGPYVDIVDTLQVTLTTDRTDYRFKDAWRNYKSISDANLKIPLVRKTYHDEPYDSIMCLVDDDDINFAFPSSLRAGHQEDSLHTFTLSTIRHLGTNVVNVEGKVASYTSTSTESLTELMDLSSVGMAEIRLVDDYGKKPDWCEIESKGTNTLTMRCKSNGIRTPRSANIYFAYVVVVNNAFRYVNFKLTVSQASLFQYANNQTLIHTPGASGDPLMADGRQQAHENKRILYYYNPGNYGKDNQYVELPVRERGFYGWWRWYREGKDEYDNDVSDTDAPDSLWITPPRNVGKYNFPFRIIGDSVWKDEDDHSKGKQLVTMGRYTVFHYPAVDYKTKVDPASKSPMVVPPINKKVLTYVVDLSAYYDNLPLSMAHVNQIDTAVLDTLRDILEPTLSLREAFELHPWTEMADTMDHYKSANAATYELRNEKYMEDHEVMAPIGNRLLLKTEQRYRYNNLKEKGHSESLLGYYMRDDNWSSMSSTPDEDGVSRQDTMIWCGGWDGESDCLWFTYDPSSKTYTACNHKVTVEDDFLEVPAKQSISAGNETDTVYYCLRSRSKKTTRSGTPERDNTVDGDYWFNICRYRVIYHSPKKYGPLLENTKTSKAIITNDEIEQNYEVLERLNFDYVKPGKDYHVYPHPLPWADASYGYSYPVRSDIPDNRYHNDFAPNFAGTGEYGLINVIPYSNYWHKMEQHGGKENGYMIYCDGMSSAGQVAALSLETKLCVGQKMYFSGFVGNCSNQTGKANPNFTFSVQGSEDGNTWKDITTYMTGDVEPKNQWYQIFFPISHEGDYDHFRVRIYNMASTFDGNDFIIDDMCIFATKPPLIAYQANTRCVDEGENDSITNVVLRVDYQGFVDTLAFNNANIFYTVDKMTKDSVFSFVPMEDGYLNQNIIPGKADPVTPDTIYGYIPMPSHTYVPFDKDSIFTNLQQLVDTFNKSNHAFNKGYLYESLDGVSRPVLYVIHEAKMTADNTYTVRMAAGDGPNGYRGLLNSICAMTSNLKVTNRMVLELNGEEVAENEVTDMCANTTYDLSMRIKGSLFIDSVAPLDINGSCVNDWLLYGDTAEASSLRRYGYKYSDIKTVIMDVLRRESTEAEPNRNQFAPNFASINKNDIIKYADKVKASLSTGVVAYDLLDSLVSKGFLKLYQPNLTATVTKNDSIQYVIFPILGTGSNTMNNEGMEVCPTPIVIKLKPSKGGDVPMMVGGINRDSTQMNMPVAVLVNARTANDQFALHIDSIMPTVAIHSISLISTDDPDLYIGVHLLHMDPDKIYNFGGDNSGYYKKGDDIYLKPSTSNNYQMRPGYSYTFGIVMQSITGSLDGDGGCPVGVVPFTLSLVPDYLRWAPQSSNNKWNNPENWIGVDDNNNPIPGIGHFAPLPSTDIIIPAMTDGMPYPVMQDPTRISSTDSVKEVNFAYNTCDDIRFLPGAAIGQQQHLNCDVVVVDMTIPQKTWTLRSAPLTGMISGDLFMAEADLSGETRWWSVGQFDASGRSYSTGNATFWLSLYNTSTIHKGNNDNIKDSIIAAADEWSKVTNGMTLSLPPAQGWAVYARTASGDAADVRLPKSDDIYYYFTRDGDKVESLNEPDLKSVRNTLAGGTAGKLAFHPDGSSQNYTLTNGVASTSFVFGNPTLGYIDIWGFINDNSLVESISYLAEGGVFTSVTKATAEASTDTIINQLRYLPPMQAMVVSVAAAATSKVVTLNANRIVTSHTQVVRGGGAPARHSQITNHKSPIHKGIMTVTAVNPVSSRCISRLLIGQGYNDAILSGEDALLTTLNIDKFHMTNTPTTPFNIYSVNSGYGLSIDLRDSIVNIPLSFYMSNLSYQPITNLWFTGVNNINGQLVLYDALTGSERPIIDGICLDIETPEVNHEVRYYIRRSGWSPIDQPTNPIVTGVDSFTSDQQLSVDKIIRHGQVFVLRNGHVYTMFGQKIR